MIHAFVCNKNLVHGAILCEHTRPRTDLMDSVCMPNEKLNILVFKDTEYNDLWKECIQSPYLGTKPKFSIKENKLYKV